MLQITARFADAWQAAWFGPPDDDFRSGRAALLEACAAVGRETPIEIFAGVDVNDESDENAHVAIDANAIADALSAWVEEGVEHVQVRVHPGTHANFEIALDGIRRSRR
jgi:alkanesulfonate monooxygenase SsuD/methylene tetrahydromethanopterin reductase-like flavin-dependent oxidoreductase (luciferase family)